MRARSRRGEETFDARGASAAKARQYYRRTRTRCYSRGGGPNREFREGSACARVSGGSPVVVIVLIFEARRPVEGRPGTRGIGDGLEHGGEGENGRPAGDSGAPRSVRTASRRDVGRAPEEDVRSGPDQVVAHRRFRPSTENSTHRLLHLAGVGSRSADRHLSGARPIRSRHLSCRGGRPPSRACRGGSGRSCARGAGPSGTGPGPGG
jgi:hypothetical protein